MAAVLCTTLAVVGVAVVGVAAVGVAAGRLAGGAAARCAVLVSVRCAAWSEGVCGGIGGSELCVAVERVGE